MIWLLLRVLLVCLCLLSVRGKGNGRVQSAVGRREELPCDYSFEDQGAIAELSLQWRSPAYTMLCRYIKHKSFRNCTPGYSLDYKPGRIRLIIENVRGEDFGNHTCSVSKQHEYSDFIIQLSRMARILMPSEDNKNGVNPDQLDWHNPSQDKNEQTKEFTKATMKSTGFAQSTYKAHTVIALILFSCLLSALTAYLCR